MSVRAKMSCAPIERGQIGASLSFSAVYEGSEELQGISENAIFGKATPAGWLNLVGPVDANQFTANEEYYIDLMSQGHGSVRPANDMPAVVMASVSLSYRSFADPNAPDNPIQFRYGLNRPFGGMLNLHIVNPAAIAWLDEHSDLDMLIRQVRGRRSDREIELREAEVEKMAAYAREEYGKRSTDRYTNVDPAHSLDEHVARRTESYRRKLAIAKGETV